MIAVKLSKGDVVATGLQARSDPATTAVNRQDVIPRAVRDEETRRSLRSALHDEPG